VSLVRVLAGVGGFGQDAKMTAETTAARRAPRDSNAGGHMFVCASCGKTFGVHGGRASTAKFCSMACRDAGKRVDFPCEVCDKTVSLKVSDAAKRRFCSRACMRVALGCRFCSKMRPVSRRDETFCSDKCELLDRLHRDGDEDGVHRALCGKCQRILPASEFTKEKGQRNGLSGRCKSCTRDHYERTKLRFQERRYTYQAAPGGVMLPFTEEQLAARVSMWGGRCWMCGVPGATQRDHVKPISKAGPHCLSNIRPVCWSCNASKQARWPLRPGEAAPRFRYPDVDLFDTAEAPVVRVGRVDFTCPVCGVTTNRRASDVKNRSTCSKKCAAKAMTLPLVTLVCPACGTTFDVHHSTAGTRKFCTKKCADLTHRSSRVIVSCRHCGRPIESWPSVADKRRFCDRACHRAHQRSGHVPVSQPTLF